MNTKELFRYETPRISQYISNDFLQDLMARYVAFKVNRKLKRYNEYLRLEKWVKKHINKCPNHI